MNQNWLAILLGLSAAFCWGAGDFNGGLATRRSSVWMVLIISQTIGGVSLIAAAWLWGEPWPNNHDVLWSMVAGVVGEIGLLALYRGLATRRMGLMAPLTAVITGILPIGVGIAQAGMPPMGQVLGFGLALAAVWLLARDEASAAVTGLPPWRELLLPLVSGLGFGLFFICLDQLSPTAFFWPLVVARATSVGLMVVVVGWMKGWQRPPRTVWPLLFLAGWLDVGGNLFFIAAANLGRLDVTTVLGALYPAATILLAWLVLRERLARWQQVGVVLALTAVALIAASG